VSGLCLTQLYSISLSLSKTRSSQSLKYFRVHLSYFSVHIGWLAYHLWRNFHSGRTWIHQERKRVETRKAASLIYPSQAEHNLTFWLCLPGCLNVSIRWPRRPCCCDRFNHKYLYHLSFMSVWEKADNQKTKSFRKEKHMKQKLPTAIFEGALQTRSRLSVYRAICTPF